MPFDEVNDEDTEEFEDELTEWTIGTVRKNFIEWPVSHRLDFNRESGPDLSKEVEFGGTAL